MSFDFRDKAIWLDDERTSTAFVMPSARELDQFYTSPALAQKCHKTLINVLSRQEPMLRLNTAYWLEPSAGACAFYDCMPVAPQSRGRLGCDLDPQGAREDIVQQDFLKFSAPPQWSEPDSIVITEGNPPFGKNASLAIKFFNKAAQFSNVIAFIVPKTFYKESVNARLDGSFECIYTEDMPDNAFIFEGKPYDVPCCFKIWVKREYAVKPIVERGALAHVDFDFVNRDTADFAFRRVGGNAGCVYDEFAQYADASHYFIKANIDKNALRTVLESIDWELIKKHNAGNPSISKRELVREYAKNKPRKVDV